MARPKKIKIAAAVGLSIGLGLFVFCSGINKSREWLDRLQPKSAEQLSPAEIDTNEYPPGFPAVKMEASEQLSRFPLPRFAPGHRLLPNFLWMDPNYIGNSGIHPVPKGTALASSVTMQLELASHWNYYLQVSPNTSVDYPSYGGNPWVKLANAHPELPASAISFWIQMAGNHVYTRQPEDPWCLHDENGQLITHVTDHNGVHREGKLLSPGMPLEPVAKDGAAERGYIKNLLRHLTRPLNCINEEDEIFTVYDSSTLKRDPALVADKQKMKISNWDIYQAEKIKKIETTFRDSFMSLPELKNTLFSVYGIDGHAHYRFPYSVMRKANSPVNGHYYSTPDFYPRYPSNWRYWSGPWHGLSWIFESRPAELAEGDSLYSPFVAAGWDGDPTKNICPAQWLGLLKLLAMTGAEFYYTGFFNERQPFPNPETYIWQAAMPAYAQAITSRYETIFRQGEIMNIPDFVIPAGDRRIVVIAKRLKGKKIYAITGTIQNSSNKRGDAPLTAIARITLDGIPLRFEVRRQGSTYIYNAEDPEHPVFYQLDGWHEAVHPSRWTPDFKFEAELFDSAGKEISVKTGFPEKEHDYSEFTSYISSGKAGAPSAPVKYYFTPRDSGASYTFQIRARSTVKNAGLRVFVDGQEIATLLITGNDWRWYAPDEKRISALFHLPSRRHEFELVLPDSSVEIDKFTLKYYR